ncbi:MAG: GDYXXLXY domain-containing protein [Hyphomonadaceae bacterium]
MKLNAAPRIIIVASLCAAALVSLVVTEGLARQGGQEALLPIEAVDPRSLLSGHYVMLNLTQRLEPGQVCPPEGEWEWMALRRDGEAYRLVGGAPSREEAQQVGPLPVKGTFTCSPPSTASEGVPATPGWVRLDIGIDRFHINQRDALRIENLLREQAVDESSRAFAIVSVGRDGRARLAGLMVDGERLELNWL